MFTDPWAAYAPWWLTPSIAATYGWPLTPMAAAAGMMVGAPWWMGYPGGSPGWPGAGMDPVDPGAAADPPQDMRPGMNPPTPEALGALHVVLPGQSVWQIARIYGVRMEDLIRMNRMRPPFTIYPGQLLRLPRLMRRP